MHEARAGKTQRLAGSPFQARPQREVLAFDLLHRQLPHRVLCGREMPLIDSCLVRVVTRDAKGSEQGLEFQEHRILPRADDVREHSPCAMSERMPQPSLSLFGSDKTPQFIQLGGALGPAAADAGRRGCQHEVGVLQRGDFFLIRRSRSWD